MKTICRILTAALVSSLAFVSCTKVNVSDEGNVSKTDGARTIVVSFENGSTKSALEGLQPKFATGDVIKVSNGTNSADCNVIVIRGVAFITTELTGALTMVYPAAAAKMNGNAINGILVPTVQDGTFASANICMAEIAAGAESATFENQTAVFKITPPDGVKKFTITSLKQVVNEVARTGKAKPINTEGADDAAKLVITVGGDASELTTFYVSLVAGVKLTDLSFEYKISEVQGAMKGIPMKSITENSLTDATTAGTLYTIDSNNWHEYVVLVGKKWATMNVGATKPEEWGLYFAWGETTGHSLIEDWKSKWDEYERKYSEVFNPGGYSFDWEHTPFNNGKEDYDDLYSYRYHEECPNGILALKYDAANVNWGGSWRMPIGEELEALDTLQDGWDSSRSGHTFGTPPAQILLPAAGKGRDVFLSNAGDFGYYSSSSLFLGMQSDNVGIFYYEGSEYNISCNARCEGQSVRPVSD